MNGMKKVPLIGGNYSGYDAYVPDDWWGSSLFVCQKELGDNLRSGKNIPNIDYSYVPANGDEICVVPRCPIAQEDIRKNYAIKRNIDSATCNVFSPVDGNRLHNTYHSPLLVHEKKSVLLLADTSEASDVIKQLWPGFVPDKKQ